MNTRFKSKKLTSEQSAIKEKVLDYQKRSEPLVCIDRIGVNIYDPHNWLFGQVAINEYKKKMQKRKELQTEYMKAFPMPTNMKPKGSGLFGDFEPLCIFYKGLHKLFKDHGVDD